MVSVKSLLPRLCAGVVLVLATHSVLAQNSTAAPIPPGFELRDDIVHAINTERNPESSWPDIVRARATMNYIGGFYSAASFSQFLQCPEIYNSDRFGLDTLTLMRKIVDWINAKPQFVSQDKVLIMWFALDVDNICESKQGSN